MKIGRFAFLRPPLGDLGATYDDHLRLIGKRVVDFLLALMELFSLGVTAEALRAIIGWKSAISFQWGPVDPKFQVEGVCITCSAVKTTKTKICRDLRIFWASVNDETPSDAAVAFFWFGFVYKLNLFSYFLTYDAIVLNILCVFPCCYFSNFEMNHKTIYLKTY